MGMHILHDKLVDEFTSKRQVPRLFSLAMDGYGQPVFEELHKYVKERVAKEPLSMYDAIEEFIADTAENGKGEPGF